MFLTFPLLVGWVAAAAGWGGLLVLVRKFLKVQNPYAFDVLEPFVGLVILTTLTNLLNFVRPITSDHALWAVIAGWVFLAVRWYRAKFTVPNPIWIVLGLGWIAVISTQAVLQAWNSDSGLYHIPAIRWTTQEMLPFGLANLHGRLGFNSSWFSLSALMTQIVSPFAANYTAAASETLFSLVGLSVIYAFRRFVGSRTVDPATVFLLMMGLLGFSYLVITNLSSPSTDHPVLLLALMLIYVALRTVPEQDAARRAYDLFLMVTLYFFVVSIKVSMLPLGLIPLWFFLVMLKRRQMSLVRFAPLVVVGALIALPWLGRGLVMSGCALYPVYATCMPEWEWTVRQASAENEATYVASWARSPRTPPDQVFANWNWVNGWFARLTGSIDFRIPFAAFVIGVILLAMNWRAVLAYPDKLHIVAILVCLLLCIAYWFITAPDLRFGVSWFWAIALITLAFGVWFLYQVPMLVNPLRLAAILVLLGAAWSTSIIGTGYVDRAGWDYHRLWYAVPPIPASDVQVSKNNQGIEISVSQSGRCYWSALVCTPYFEPTLRLHRTPDTRLYFTFPKE